MPSKPIITLSPKTVEEIRIYIFAFECETFPLGMRLMFVSGFSSRTFWLPSLNQVEREIMSFLICAAEAQDAEPEPRRTR